MDPFDQLFVGWFQVSGGEAEDLRKAFGAREHLFPEAPLAHAYASGAHCQPQPLLAPLQGLPVTVAFGNVFLHADKIRQPPFGIEDRGDR